MICSMILQKMSTILIDNKLPHFSLFWLLDQHLLFSMCLVSLMFHMIVRIAAIFIDYSFGTVCQDQKPYVDLSMTFNFAISGSTMFNSFNIGWVMLTKLQRSWNSVSVSKSSFSVHADRISCLWYVIFFKLVGGCKWQSFARQCLNVKVNLHFLKLISIYSTEYEGHCMLVSLSVFASSSISRWYLTVHTCICVCRQKVKPDSESLLFWSTWLSYPY